VRARSTQDASRGRGPTVPRDRSSAARTTEVQRLRRGAGGASTTNG
jgi:hypothetical protein